MPTRRRLVTALTALALVPALPRVAAAAAPRRMTVLKSPTCGCCTAWVAHMADAGFAVAARDVDGATLEAAKEEAGLAPALRSCHTAFVDGYAIEGHVPAGDVLRLLDTRPAAIGLAVPGMPVGSPGMEMGGRRDPYDTLLVRPDGSVAIFARHNRG